MSISGFISDKNRTKRYKAAIEALHFLAEENQTAAKLACAEYLSHSMYRNWLHSDSGYEKTKGSQHYSRLLGKRPGYVEPKPFEDHVDLYIRDGKPALWMAQPYQVLSEDIRELARLTDNYEISIVGGSWYYPANTVMIEMKKKTGS